MKKIAFSALVVSGLMLAGAPVLAQTGAAAAAADRGDPVMDVQDLAQKMHEIRPLRPQVEMVVEEIAQRVPEESRTLFKARMMEEIDFEKLESMSEEAMAEVFTADELQRMVDYFGSPEIASIDNKMPVFQQLVQPEITRMVDRALMVVRTGKAAEDEAAAE